MKERHGNRYIEKQRDSRKLRGNPQDPPLYISKRKLRSLCIELEGKKYELDRPDLVHMTLSDT